MEAIPSGALKSKKGRPLKSTTARARVSSMGTYAVP
jgi:hypothetical protein